MQNICYSYKEIADFFLSARGHIEVDWDIKNNTSSANEKSVQESENKNEKCVCSVNKVMSMFYEQFMV